MNKAEERAKERYSIVRGDDTQETSGIDMQGASDFIEGYHQAEKDLALTWEAISTDKIQKILEEIVRMHNLLPVMDGDNISINYADRICTTLEMYIDSLQKEPVSEGLEEEKELELDRLKVREFMELKK